MEWPTHWRGQTWTTYLEGYDVVLTEPELRAFFDAIPLGEDAMCKTLGVPSRGSEKAQRPIKILVAERLISWNPSTRRWEHTTTKPAELAEIEQRKRLHDAARSDG